jgi:hypothetical protein
MRSILPEEGTVFAKFDLMGRCSAVCWLLLFIVSLLVSCIVSFAPPATLFRSQDSPSISAAQSSITFSHTEAELSSLSAFVVAWVYPNRALSGANVSVSSSVRTLAAGGTSSDAISMETAVAVGDRVRVFERSWVSFYSVAITATVQAVVPVLYGFRIEVVSQHPVIAIVAFVMITILTAVLILVLMIAVSRRLRPTRLGQWATLVLGLCAFLIDGPWLVLRYHTPRVCSQLFDLGPEIFHVVFIVSLTFFIAERTFGFANRLFDGLVLQITFAVSSLVVLILEFVITQLMPLCTLSIYIGESSLKYPTVVLSALVHIAVVLLLIIGVLSVQIEKLLVLIVAAFTFFVLEAIYIVRMYIRFFIPVQAVGVAFGADVFYILMANIVTIFFLVVNLPIKPQIPRSMSEIVSETGDDGNEVTAIAEHANEGTTLVEDGAEPTATQGNVEEPLLNKL